MSSIANELLNNRYRLEYIIGQGGFGAVYYAYDTVLKQPYAIKENLSTTPEAQRQFEREALILAGLRHPNLPRVIDHFFLPDQGQYLVMDFIEGQSLSEILLTRAAPLTQEEAINWGRQICQALNYLHQHNPPIIHRDIKPQNIIITPEGRAMLVDFGLSKIYGQQDKTSVGAQGVTFGYAPPEQYGQGRTDTRADIYGLGATLYTLLTNHRPPDAIKRLMGEISLLPPHKFNQKVSPQVEWVILKAMETISSRRFQTVTDFQQALTRPIPTTEPDGATVSQAPKITSKLGRVIWRRGILIGVTILMVLGGAGLGFGWLESWGRQPGAAATATALSSEMVVRFNTATSPPPTYTITPTFSPLTQATNPTSVLPTATSTSLTMTVTSTLTPSATPVSPTATSTLTPTVTPSLAAPTQPPSATPTPESLPPTAAAQVSTPTPSPYQFTPIGWHSQDMSYGVQFRGRIFDTSGNPINGYSIYADNGSFRVMSHPTGASYHYPETEDGAWDINFFNPEDAEGRWVLSVVRYECPGFEVGFNAQCEQFTRLSEEVEVEVTGGVTVFADWVCHRECDQGVYQ